MTERVRWVADPNSSMSYYYAAVVSETGKRRKPWKCTIRKRFGNFSSEPYTSRRFRTEQKAEAWGTARLDKIEARGDGRWLS